MFVVRLSVISFNSWFSDSAYELRFQDKPGQNSGVDESQDLTQVPLQGMPWLPVCL